MCWAGVWLAAHGDGVAAFHCVFCVLEALRRVLAACGVVCLQRAESCACGVRRSHAFVPLGEESVAWVLPRVLPSGGPLSWLRGGEEMPAAALGFGRRVSSQGGALTATRPER